VRKTVSISLFKELLNSCSVVKETACLDTEIVSILDNSKSTNIVSFLNFHAINISVKNKAYYSVMTEADYLYRDGVGVEIALKAMSKESGLNMNGTDFIPKIISASIDKNMPIILWGTELEYLSKARTIINDQGGDVIDVMDGFQQTEAYISKLKKLDVNNAVIILGMGMPKQEFLAEKIKENFPSGYSIINGGAIIDFIAGKQPRAPILMRKLKLEFLFRLLKEPKRLFRRTVLGGIQFILATALLFIHNILGSFSGKKYK